MHKFGGNQMKRVLLLMIAVSLFICGFASNPPLSELPDPDGEGAFVELVVDWDYIDALHGSGVVSAQGVGAQSDLPPATHVGVRLVLPNISTDRDGVYMESTARESAEKNGLIAFKIPPVPNAYLQVIVVHRSTDWREPTNYLYFVGLIDDLSLEIGALNSYSFQDVELLNLTDKWKLTPPWDAFWQTGERKLKVGEKHFFQWESLALH